MTQSKPLNTGQKATVALLVTWVAGLVDTLGFLMISEILTGNMTGNTLRVAVASAELDWNTAAHRFWPVLMFVAGLIISACIHEAGARLGILQTSGIVFFLEAVLLAGVIALFPSGHFQVASIFSPVFYPAVAMLAIGMGLQNATVTRVGALSIRTTHTTGTLSEFAEGFSQFLFWMFDRQRKGKDVFPLAKKTKPFRETVMMAGLWIAFFAGGICAAFAGKRYGALALLPGIAILLLLAGIDMVRPIASSQEHQSPGR